jgi:hypothetical protein
MIRHFPKRYCPLCRDAATEKLGDHIYKCVRCGYVVDESKGSSAYHRQILVAKPSIIGNRFQKRHFIKDEDIPSRSQMFQRINKDLQTGTRYDRQSMYNPNNKLEPGKVSNADAWMSAVYANMETDAVTPDKEDSFHKTLQTRKYEY